MLTIHLSMIVLGMSGPLFGMCPVDRDWMTERYNRGEGGMSWVTDPPEAPR